MAVVTGIEEGFSNTMRFPYALAKLDCGHDAAVHLRDTRGVCGGCGVLVTHPHGGTFARCTCGAFWARQIDGPNPHCAADRLTAVGDAVECNVCAQEAAMVARVRELPRGVVHHARPRHGAYQLYRHDPASPSGFLLVGSVPMTAAGDAALREMGISAISPTERA